MILKTDNITYIKKCLFGFIMVKEFGEKFLFEFNVSSELSS